MAVDGRYEACRKECRAAGIRLVVATRGAPAGFGQDLGTHHPRIRLHG
jgi:hypothetical protein